MQKAVGQHHPYKTARYSGGRKDPHIDATLEEAKVKTPKLYQSIKHEEALAQASRPIIDAMLDDPAIIALLDEMTKDRYADKQSVMAKELALLGIEAGASKRDVRNAYRRKARKLHPDAGGDAEAFKQLHAAYRALLKTAKE